MHVRSRLRGTGGKNPRARRADRRAFRAAPSRESPEPLEPIPKPRTEEFASDGVRFGRPGRSEPQGALPKKNVRGPHLASPADCGRGTRSSAARIYSLSRNLRERAGVRAPLFGFVFGQSPRGERDRTVDRRGMSGLAGANELLEKAIGMRLLLVSDLHYTLKQLDWVHGGRGPVRRRRHRRRPPRHLVGGRGRRGADRGRSSSTCAGCRAKTRLVVSSGNHDLTATRRGRREAARRWMSPARAARGRGRRRHPRDRRHRDHGLPVVGRAAGCAAVGAQLARDAERARPAVDLGLPRAARRLAGELGRHAALRRRRAPRAGSRQYRPDIVLTGHIHQSPFRNGGSWVDRIGDTWVFNAGRQIGPSPTHVIVDPGAPARDVVLAGRQRDGAARRAARPRPIARAQSTVGSGSRSEPGSTPRRPGGAPAFEHLVDHRQVVVAALELALQIDQVAW